MHEQALLQDLRRELEAIAAREGARRVVRARFWIGALAHLRRPRLEEAWPEVVAGTPAAGAALEVEVSTDPTHPRAQSVMLLSVVLSDEPAKNVGPSEPGSAFARDERRSHGYLSGASRGG